jgi:hypothetical protein
MGILSEWYFTIAFTLSIERRRSVDKSLRIIFYNCLPEYYILQPVLYWNTQQVEEGKKIVLLS